MIFANYDYKVLSEDMFGSVRGADCLLLLYTGIYNCAIVVEKC